MVGMRITNAKIIKMKGNWCKWGCNAKDNSLKNVPHTAEVLVANEWNHAYGREVAAYPVPALRKQKYWAPVGRADNVYGDRNLFCACVPMSDYE